MNEEKILVNQPQIAREALFNIDGGKTFRGYTLGESWNGFACPYFTKETALEVCKSTSCKYETIAGKEECRTFYDETTDTFYCEDYYNGYEREIIASPTEITIENGTTIKVYSFGDAGWCWDEVEDKQKIFGIIIKSGDTFEVTTDFSLTEEETQTILNILANHANEGGSSAGLGIEEMEDYLRGCCQNQNKENTNIANNNRLITLSDGTGMGDSVYVFKTNAPIEELKALEEESNNIYLKGGSSEDIPIWATVLEKKGYIFEYEDECQHITPHGTSESWLADKYDNITEHYQIDNQPNM